MAIAMRQGESGGEEHGGVLALTALLLGNAALAVGPWLVRLADTGPVAAGFWRLTLAMPILYILAWRGRQQLTGYGRRIWIFLAIAGVLFAVDLASWHIGIARTKLANAALFGNCGSIIMVIYGFAIGRAWPKMLEWIAVALALVGAALLMGASYELSVDSLVGDLFCIAAGIFYAGYLIAMRGARGKLGSWAVLGHASAFGALPMLGIALALDETIWPGNWTPLFTLALSSQIVGQGLLIYALRHFSPLVIGLALLTQPAIAATVGWLAFAETLSTVDFIGMLAIGLALVLVRLPEARAARRARGAPVAVDPGRA